MLEDDPVNLGDALRCRECGRFTGGKPWLPPHRTELTLHGSACAGPTALRRGTPMWPWRPGGAAVDEARSSLVRSEEVACERCHYGGVLSSVGGFRVESGTWTSEDIFIPRGLPGTVVVTERFRRCAESHGLTNVRLEPTEA